jgi:hypothetical protein
MKKRKEKKKKGKREGRSAGRRKKPRERHGRSDGRRAPRNDLALCEEEGDGTLNKNNATGNTEQKQRETTDRVREGRES